MSAYCTIDDVNRLLVGWQIDTNSDPTSDEVTNDIIPEADAELEDRLRVLYQMPVTGTNALATMKRLSAWLTASKIAERVYIGQTPSDSPQASTWRTYVENDLKRILNGQIILTDAVMADNTPASNYTLISDTLSTPFSDPKPHFSSGMTF